MRNFVRAISLACVAPAMVACGDDASKPAVCESNLACEQDDPNLPLCNMETGACEAIPPCESDAVCAAADAAMPLCSPSTQRCEALPPGHAIGYRFGTADSVDITTIFKPSKAYEATDLGFVPGRDELWVINRYFEVDGVCGENSGFNARCASLEGFVQIIKNVGLATQTAEQRTDENGWHFMRRPLAMAIGAGETWGSCSEADTGNYEDDPVMYNGPSLWSLDLSVFARPSGQNGSHLDMLHNTPQCVGMAHEDANIYWLFNGFRGSIDRTDFAADHGPGWHDHSDGTIHRYAEGQLARVENSPGHLEFNHDDQHLYISDSGNGRIVKLDTNSGTFSGPFRPNYEPLAAFGNMADAILTDVVPPGRIAQPGGLALHEGLLYVVDVPVSRFLVFDLTGKELRSLDTGLPPYSIGGIEMGPDGHIYFTNRLTGEVHRIDPK